MLESKVTYPTCTLAFIVPYHSGFDIWCLMVGKFGCPSTFLYAYIHIYIYTYIFTTSASTKSNVGIQCELEWLVKFGGLIILGSGFPSLSLT